MLYFFGIRELGSDKYKDTGECLQSDFQKILQEAGKIKKETGKRTFVDFRQRAHTFEVDVSEEGKVETHLLNPETDQIVKDMSVNLNIKDAVQGLVTDPALAAQFEGS